MHILVIRLPQDLLLIQPEGQSVYKCVFSTYYVSDPVLNIVLKKNLGIFFWLENKHTQKFENTN